MAEERLRRQPEPKNYAFQYRGIIHVAPPREGFSEDDHKEEVIAKYKKSDNKVKVLSPLDVAKEKITELESVVKVEKEESRQFVHAGEQKVVDVIVGTKTTYSEQIEPETPASVGSGICPTCHKKFKRLDMHVCKEFNQESKE